MNVKKKNIADAGSWVEISRDGLKSNLACFRELIGSHQKLMAVVKANAYGHGMVQVAMCGVEAGADFLGVFSVEEGLTLLEHGLNLPILVLGPAGSGQVDRGIKKGLRLTVSSVEMAEMVAEARGDEKRVHLKLETGTNRQGLRLNEVEIAVRRLQQGNVIIEGAYTHFADIEDTTDHRFAEKQLRSFSEHIDGLRRWGVQVPLLHTACSAATILFPDTHFDLVRVGIGMYGLWSSKETMVSAKILGRQVVGLRPVLTWKTRVAQIKVVEVGEFVGYGRTYRATRTTRLAVLPVGYADGYDRHFSSSAHVLVGGMRAPVLGRVCMNLTMVDITDIQGVTVGDPVVLLGAQGEEEITAGFLASLAGTINYEIVSRISPLLPRIVV